MGLAGIGKRRTPKNNPTALSTKSQRMKRRAQPLFDVDTDEDSPLLAVADDDDPVMQLALRESLESQEKADLQHAFEMSRNESQVQQSAEATPTAGSSIDVAENLVSEASDGDELNVPGRLETALAIANAGPTPKSISMAQRPSSSFPEASFFNAPKLLIDQAYPSPDLSEDAPLEYLDELDEVAQVVSPIVSSHTTPKAVQVLLEPLPTSTDELPQVETVEERIGDDSDSDEDMEPVLVPIPENKLSVPPTLLDEPPKLEDMVSTPRRAARRNFDNDTRRTSVIKTPSPDLKVHHPAQKLVPEPDSEGEHVISDWSRSPSPVADALLATEAPASKASTVEDSWDAAQEMDPHAEEGEFARFLSQVKGKDLDDVRREIDDEIKTLNQQKKAAMRDSEDITQQMIAQIMVRSYHTCLHPSEYSPPRR